VRPIYRTAVPLPSTCCILYIFSTNISTGYFKHAAHSPFFSSNCRLFHNATFFWFLYDSHFYIQGVLKFKCKTPVPKGYYLGREFMFIGAFFSAFCCRPKSFKTFEQMTQLSMYIQGDSRGEISILRCDSNGHFPIPLTVPKNHVASCRPHVLQISR
jgi:hypothetical protein